VRVSAAASLFNATTEVRDRFWMKQPRRAQNASAALRIFLRHPKQTFATTSAKAGSRFRLALPAGDVRNFFEDQADHHS